MRALDLTKKILIKYLIDFIATDPKNLENTQV